MKQNLIWFLCIGVCLLVAILWEFLPRAASEDRLGSIPLAGKNFWGNEMPLTENEKAAIGAAEAIKRGYIFDGKEFLVTVLDATQNRSAVHDPSYCLRGGSSEPMEEGFVDLASGQAKRWAIESGETRKELLCWFSSPKGQYSSFPRYWFYSALRRMTLGYGVEEPLFVVVQAEVPLGETVPWEAASKEWFAEMGL